MRLTAALRRFFIGTRIARLSRKGECILTAMNKNTKTLTRAALIASLYAALTLLLQPISYGQIQLRVSEALTLLPVLLPESIPALAVGCLIANVLGGCTLLDIVFGTLATLLAAVCTRLARKNTWLAAAMPVLFNGIIVGSVVHAAYSPSIPLFLCMLSVAAGEAVVCFLLGPMVVRMLERLPAQLIRE